MIDSDLYLLRHQRPDTGPQGIDRPSCCPNCGAPRLPFMPERTGGLVTVFVCVVCDQPEAPEIDHREASNG